MKKVKIENSSLEIPTYAWCGKDREAPFLREFTTRGQPIYPYRPLEHVESSCALRKYRCVVFENEFLKLLFLPEVNGRLYSAFDKVHGKELFYKNPQMKPALFGLRGAWCATGVEYNFPNSHSTTTLDPVMTRVLEHRDGSASFICGDCERVGRMLWSVEVILKPGIASIEMVSRLYNCTDYPRRFYYWLNAAVPVYPETRLIYPESTGRLYTHPPMEISTIGLLDYPVHKGRDISVFRNIPQHFPVFAEEMKEDFFGIYHPHMNCGLVHLADHSLVRGRKIWLFGNSRDGKMWIDRLTDSGIDYCELQAGPFTLQSDYRLFPPGKMRIQRDVWIPVGNTGGFNAVSEKIAANILRDDGKIRIRLSAVCQITGATIVVKSGTACICRNLSLSALEVKELKVGSIKGDDYSVEMVDAEGAIILSYHPRKRRAKKSLPSSRMKIRNRYLEGLYREEQGWYEKAYRLYSEDSSHESAKAAARMDMDSGLYEKALSSFDKLLLADGSNGEALLYSGICLKKLGDYCRAEERFSRCCDDASFINDALSHLAQISIIRKDYARALERLEHLKRNSGLTGYNHALYILAMRKIKYTAAIPTQLSIAEANTPFEPLAMGESFFAGKCEVTVPINSHVLIEILCRYINLKEYRDALEIVSSFTSGRKEMPALVWYYRAYIEQHCERQEDAEKSMRKAAKVSGEWDFVSGNESAEVLKYALGRKPGNSKILYHLGNYYAHKRRWNEALGCWRQVKGELKSLSLRNEGLYWWKTAGNRKKALKFYREAADRGNCGARTLWEYDTLLAESGNTSGRLELVREHSRIFDRDERLLLRKADSLLAAGKAEGALDIIENNTFHLCEGHSFPRVIYEGACRMLGERYRKKRNFEKALEYFSRPLEYPENLGVGKPAANMECEWYWRCGMVCREKGDNARAKDFFRRGSEKGDGIDIDSFPLKKLVWQHDTEVPNPRVQSNTFFRALCFKMLGRKTEYLRLLSLSKKTSP